jgi:putative lipoic acid-binding regulatory protein
MADNQSEAPELWVFPMDFPIKVMGLHSPQFETLVVALVREHAPDLDLATVEVRSSSSARYLSVTVTVRAVSREQLDAIYRSLTGHPAVRMVL